MKTLLLNSNYQVLSFFSFKRIIKLLAKDKIEILAEWDNKVSWSSGSMKIPAIVRLKYHVKGARFVSERFNRYTLFKRDEFTCQYCGKPEANHKKLTVDHIVPRSKGGRTSWLNCVTCCFSCNSKKGNKLISDTDMRILSAPKPPNKNPAWYEFYMTEPKHNEWEYYIGK